MSIVIHGMEMPKVNQYREFYLIGEEDGTATVHNPNTGEKIGIAIPLPAGYGRLIDADALLNDKGIGTQIAGWGKMFHETAIAYAPTIVPAEGGSADGNP